MTHSISPSPMAAILDVCVDCDRCTHECAFLREYGSPHCQANDFNPDLPEQQFRPFLCHLCGLCVQVCPKNLDPQAMFLDMRRMVHQSKGTGFKEHKGLVSYEGIGTSKKMTWYGLPENCRTVFFPGCTLPGTRPANTMKLFRTLEQSIPNLGVVLDCCSKPSHDLGRSDYFKTMFGEMKDWLLENKVTEILVACPSCYKIFEAYGSPLTVRTVYEVMAEGDSLFDTPKMNGQVTLHDPCILRHNSKSQDAVRHLVAQKGVSVREMDHSKNLTICCGEGGAVGFLSQELAGIWAEIRKKEAKDDRMITYCAGCTNYLNPHVPCDHVVDLYFDPEKTLKGSASVAKAPFTYLNRIRFKKKLQKDMPVHCERERPGNVVKQTKKPVIIKRVLGVFALVAVFLSARHFGLQELVTGDNLNQLVLSYGLLAPLVFILIYSIAPALFLPGLPITLAGGILFGPLWGVVYSITGATLGACVSFLVSRYLARDLIMGKLTHPRWQKLDGDVQKNGWKVVALTRLIPLFPFNLLNYAFGLTKIGFLPYAVTSFICMLPGCIAFIVFSSSLTDLIRGHVRLEFVVGILLIVFVSLFPLIYKRFIAKS